MKKRMFCFIIVCILVFSTTVTVSATVSPNHNANTEDATSLQREIAKLQLEMSDVAKHQALAQMEEISNTQAEIKEVEGYLATARELKEEAATKNTETEMPSEMAQYMESKGLSYDRTGNDLKMTSIEWDYNIKSLENYQKSLSNKTQTQMVILQDYMNQYNAYLQGANNEINNSNEALSNLVRGQSMYGDSEVGLAVTGLVVGLVLGYLITLAVQKSRRKKEKA